ncbi:MAG: radical SAM protein [Oscillospiraceae bacterium]|nr:radical SAM protein [Oscillospiraceae bacterium]
MYTNKKTVNTKIIEDINEYIHYRKLHLKKVSEKLHKFKVIIEDERIGELQEKIKKLKDIYINVDKNIFFYKGRSKACEHCNNDTGCTIRLTQNCNKSCFFCFAIEDFNIENRPDLKKIKEEIANKNNKIKLESIAISGGEPFLYKNELFSILQYIRKEFANLYVRIYSNGELISKDDMLSLSRYKIDEIRLSIKPNEIINFDLLNELHKYIPNVLVEIPIIPNEENELFELLNMLNTCGITGLNAVEFFYNGYRETEFLNRNYKLLIEKGRIRPMVDSMPRYEYPIYNSKYLALKMIEYASNNNLNFFVNVCTHETKRQQFLVENRIYSKKYFEIVYRIYDNFELHANNRLARLHYDNDNMIEYIDMPISERETIKGTTFAKVIIDRNIGIIIGMKIENIRNDNAHVKFVNNLLNEDFNSDNYLLNLEVSYE